MEFERAFQALCDAGVEFVVIGGVSGTLHGSARVIYDLDICFSRSSANLKRLVSALAPFHPRLRDLPAGCRFSGKRRVFATERFLHCRPASEQSTF